MSAFGTKAGADVSTPCVGKGRPSGNIGVGAIVRKRRNTPADKSVELASETLVDVTDDFVIDLPDLKAALPSLPRFGISKREKREPSAAVKIRRASSSLQLRKTARSSSPLSNVKSTIIKKRRPDSQMQSSTARAGANRTP